MRRRHGTQFGCLVGCIILVGTPAIAGVEYGIAAGYLRDTGIEGNASVVKRETFEDASLPGLQSRWDQVRNSQYMSFSSDRPSPSGGTRSLHISGGAADLYTRLPGYATGYDELYARFYAKFDAACDGVGHWVWMGGYNPPISWPSPHAGELPAGNDRFSAGVEPYSGDGGWGWDTWHYWCRMRPWPSGSFWGNILCGREWGDSVPVQRGQWICVEMWIRLNEPATSYNGEFAFWIDGVRACHFGQGFPSGVWGTGSRAGRYDPGAGTPFEGFQWRTDASLKINWFWLEQWLGNNGELTCPVWFDDVVIATEYIGPISVEPDTTPPDIRIEAPSSSGSHSTYLPAIDVGGTATDDRGIVSIGWRNSRGGSGAATPGTSWTCAAVALQIGENVITVTATDAGANTAVDSITITRLADAEPPTVSIAAPTSQDAYVTSASTISMAGTAHDNGAVVVVVLSNAGRWSGTATGAADWTRSNVPLAVGNNTIIVKAVDAVGLVATDTLLVTLSSGPPETNVPPATNEPPATNDDPPPVADDDPPDEPGVPPLSEEWVYRVVAPEEGRCLLYVGARGADGADMSLRLLSPLGEIVGAWDGSQLESVEDRRGSSFADLGSAGISAGAYIAEIALDGETRVIPIVIIR